MKQMTEGHVGKKLMQFMLPLLVGNILQQLYFTADAIIIGRFAGKTALAAIGAATPFLNIFIFLMIGLTMGASILISEFYGAKKYEQVKETEATAIFSGAIFTVFLTGLGLLAINPILKLMQTPDDILNQSVQYLHIVIIGLIFSFLYNMLSSSLRAIGNSVSSLAFLFIASIVNIVLTLLLVRGYGLGVTGAAWGTVISQAVSAGLCLLYINVKIPELKLRLTALKINQTLLKKVITYSSVTAFQQTFLYVGVLILQGAVNSLGVNAVAAYSAVTRIEGFILSPTNSIALALTTFTAQNNGAGLWARVRSGMQSAVVMGLVYCLVISVMIYLYAPFLIKCFLPQTEMSSIALGVKYLRAISVFYLLPALCNAYQGFFRGVGRMQITLWATFIQIPIRISVAYTLLSRYGILSIVIGVACGWICMCIYGQIKYLNYYKPALE